MTTLEKIREEIEKIAPLDYPCDKRTPEHIRDMAIAIIDKYAEQEPCDDVVSREAVKELIKSGISTDTYEDIELVCKWVDEMPPVRQKEQTGHWIGIDEEPHEDYECDKCGYVVSTYTANIEPHTEYKYCPNCGARMVEPQESEDKE